MFGCLLLVLPIKPAGIVTLTIIAVYTSVKIYVNNPITDLLFVLIILSFVAGICLMINLAGQKTLHQNYQLINRLYNESITDGLTKLNNKRAFQEQIERLNAIAIRDQVPLGLILVDVDYFKTVNDSFGHTIGDLVLKKVANVVDSKCRRSTDMGFRIGGDEFALILYGINVTTLEKVCLEIVKDVSAFNLKKNDKTIRTTVSVGAVLKSENANITSNNLISLADEYLYAAKDGGRNQFHTQLFNDDLRPY
jgi:diguanylate cyclase (GGDEF)-like protein